MAVNIMIEIMIGRGRSDVAAFATDPANDCDCIGGVTRARKLTAGPVGIGTKVARVANFLGRGFEYTLEVVEIVPDERMTMTTDSPFPMKVVYEFEGTGGQTLVRIRVSGEPKGFFRLGGPFLPKMLRGNVMKDLDRLKRLLEEPARQKRSTAKAV